MVFVIRLINVCMVATIALFFTIVAVDNIIDFYTNWVFVQHVLSMDTTFRDPVMMTRAISDPTLQRIAYYLIISWEILTAVCCWMGVLKLLQKFNAPLMDYVKAKTYALVGLFLGFVLYMVGFIIIGGEWFGMWQSSKWNGQMSAGLFLNMILFVMMIVRMDE